MGFPGGSDSKMSACSVGDPGSIPGSGRSPGEGNSNPFQYSCLENSMDGGAWWATVHGVAKSQTQLSDFSFFLSFIHSFFLFHDVLKQLSSFQLIFIISLRWSLYHSHESGCRQVFLFLQLQWGKGWLKRDQSFISAPSLKECSGSYCWTFLL